MTDLHSDPEVRHLHDEHGVVRRAERFCLDRGVAFTSMRRRVLETLAASAVPLSAYDLAERLSVGKRVAPVQVYRSLEFLQEANVIHRLATKSAYVTCDHEHAQDETIVFLVCGDCGRVAETTSPVVGRGLKGAAAASGFEPHHPVVEVEGRCATCQAQH